MASSTLRRWARVGKIKSKRTEGGHRRFWVEQSIRVGVCYCRVSSSKQKDDLRRQVAAKREAYPGHEVIEDIGSGINFRRKGLNALLERVLRGSVSEVVVAHRDRLARFGFDLIEWLCVRSGTRVVVLDGAVAEPQTKLCADLVSIITVFACRIQGRRRYVSKNPDLPDCRAAADSEAMVRGCALLVQPSDNPPKDSGNEGELEGN